MTDQPSPQGSFFHQHDQALPRETVFVTRGQRRAADRPMVIYILYLIPHRGSPTSSGWCMAYVARDTAPAWLRGHYTFQIRTFWIGLLYAIIAGMLCFVLVGFLLVPIVVIWFIVRCCHRLGPAIGARALSEPAKLDDLDPPPFFTEEGDRRTTVEEAGAPRAPDEKQRRQLDDLHEPRLLHHFVVPLLRFAEEDQVRRKPSAAGPSSRSRPSATGRCCPV